MAPLFRKRNNAKDEEADASILTNLFLKEDFGMTCLETCIVAVVIGLVVLIVGCGIIQKIFEENRKNAQRAIDLCEKLVNSLVNNSGKMVKDIAKAVDEVEDERKRKKEAKTNYSKMTDDELLPY